MTLPLTLAADYFDPKPFMKSFHIDEALRVLSITCRTLRGHNLDKIDLSDNALGEKGVRACFDLLIPQSTLRRLLYCNNGISAASLIVQEIVLQNGKETQSSLQEFHYIISCVAITAVWR